jgi:hypothetical protein
MKRFIFLGALVLLLAAPALAEDNYYGDLNNDKEVDLVDTILALQVAGGLAPDLNGMSVATHEQLDVNQDGRVGVAEAIYTQQVAVGERKVFPTGASMIGGVFLALLGARRRIAAVLNRLSPSR